LSPTLQNETKISFILKSFHKSRVTAIIKYNFYALFQAEFVESRLKQSEVVAKYLDELQEREEERRDFIRASGTLLDRELMISLWLQMYHTVGSTYGVG
jgi:hypothetical protein